MKASGKKLSVIRFGNCKRHLQNLLQRLNADFLEKYHVVVTVILQSEPAFIRTATALRFELELALRNGLPLSVVSNLHTIEFDNRVRAIECDDHGVPFRARLAGFRQRLR